jgi:hypothetical protein
VGAGGRPEWADEEWPDERQLLIRDQEELESLRNKGFEIVIKEKD